MAATSVGTSDSIAQKIWRPGLIHQAEWSWIMQDLVGSDDDACIQLQEEPSRVRGDTVQIRFSPTEDQQGFGEDDDIEGNEAKLKFDFQEFKIGYWAFAFSQRNQMSQQRVNINLKKAALQKLPVLWRRQFERGFCNQLGGATYVNNETGRAAIALIDTWYDNLTSKDNNLGAMNAVTAVDSNHLFLAGAAANEVALAADSTAVMSLDLIDELVLRASSQSYLSYPIPPTSSGYWYLIVHPDQVKQLRAGTSAGDWQDLQRALLEGGEKYQRSALYRGHVGVYNNTIIVSSDYVPRGWDAANVPLANTRRALFLGAKSAVLGYGEGYTDGQHLDWVEQVRNYKVWGVATDSVYGALRTEFESSAAALETYGCINLGTYVPN